MSDPEQLQWNQRVFASSAEVTDLCFSPDGAWLFVGGHDGKVHVVDVGKAKAKQRLGELDRDLGGTSGVTVTAVSLRLLGSDLLVGERHRWCAIWRLGDRKPVFVGDGRHALLFPDGRRIALVRSPPFSQDVVVSALGERKPDVLLDLRLGSEELEGGMYHPAMDMDGAEAVYRGSNLMRERVNGLHLLADGALALSTSFFRTLVHSAESGAMTGWLPFEILRLFPSRRAAVVRLPSGGPLGLWRADDHVVALDTGPITYREDPIRPGRWDGHFAILPGDRVAVWSDEHLSIFEASGALVRRLETPRGDGRGALALVGPELLALPGPDGTLCLVDTHAPVVRWVARDQPVNQFSRLVPHPLGLASLGEYGGHVWDAATGAHIGSMSGFFRATGALSATGAFAFASVSDEKVTIFAPAPG